MDPTTAADNARSDLPQDTCSAMTKDGNRIAICDRHLHHTGKHAATMPDASTYEWRDEPW